MSSTIVGRGWSFPPNIGDRHRISLVEDTREIEQAIYIILNTAPGERVMRPDFGCEIHNLIFWPANNQTAAIMERYVTEALRRWEPRIRLVQVTARPPSDEETDDLAVRRSEQTRREINPLATQLEFMDDEHVRDLVMRRNGEMWIEISYEIKDQHDVRSLVYPFYLIPS